MRIRRGLVLACAALAVLAPAASAAGAGSASATQVAGARKVDDHTVRVLVRAPGDLTGADVRATLGGRLAFVERVRPYGPRQSLHLVFAVDTSGSMAGEPISAAIAAGQRLLDAVGSNDEVGLVEFDDSARVLAPLTSNVQGVRTALSSLTTHSGTALYDGVAAAVRLTGPDPSARRVVVVLSDGADTGSKLSYQRLRSSLAGSGVQVDAVGLTQSGSYDASQLREIASVTHGTFAPATSVSDLEPIIVQLANSQLAGEYALDVSLPHSSSHDLAVSVRGSAPAHITLPAGVSGADESLLSAYGGWLVALLGFAAILMLSTLALTAAERRPQALSARLSPYSADLSKETAKVQGAALLDVYEMLESRLGRYAPWRWLHRLGERAGSTAPTGQLFTVICACAALPALFGTIVIGPLAGLPLLVIGGLLPVLMLRFRANRRSRAFETQLPELLGVWASALRAGRSFAQALDTLVEEASDPARSEFRRAQNQVRLGVPVEQALDDMSKRLGSESFELVVLTTDVQRRIGGNVAEIFDQVADTVRKRQQFAQRVRALVAMGVLSARVLLGMPFVLAGILTLINHGYMAPLYTTQAGHILIAIALVMMSIGALVLRRMVKPRAIA
ncbi:MAG TPA: type II secretion system F family protein [Gaiellales bacterium]|nr:type II secretion system F family protein [Gaiellales bacterium]